MATHKADTFLISIRVKEIETHNECTADPGPHSKDFEQNNAHLSQVSWVTLPVTKLTCLSPSGSSVGNVGVLCCLLLGIETLGLGSDNWGSRLAVPCPNCGTHAGGVPL